MNPLVMWIWVSVGFFVIGTIVAMLPHRRSAVVAPPTRVAEVEREKELVA
jgi:hypothetical protein